MQVKYINSILNAVKKVFISMLDLSVKFDNPVRKKIHHPSYDISSMIQLGGDIKGYIVISYPKEMAKVVASEMLDETITRIDNETVDAISEIANMVIGVADTELNLENARYSLPSVFRHRGDIAYPDDSFVFSMPCTMAAGEFEVDIALSESQSGLKYEEEPTDAPEDFDSG